MVYHIWLSIFLGIPACPCCMALPSVIVWQIWVQKLRVPSSVRRGSAEIPRHSRMTSVNSTAVVRLTEEKARSWWMWILVSNGFESLDESSPKTSKTTNTDDVQPSLNYIRGTEDLCARCHDQNILQYKMQLEGFAAYLADLAQGIWIA